MTWKAILAIVAAAGIALVVGVWVGSCQGNQRFLEKDAARAAQNALLLEKAAQSGEEAAAATAKSQQAEASMNLALEAKAALEERLDVLRGKVRKRPTPVSTGELRARLDELGSLNVLLEDDLELTDSALFACTDALGSCRAANASLSQQVEAIHGAHTVQTRAAK